MERVRLDRDPLTARCRIVHATVRCGEFAEHRKKAISGVYSLLTTPGAGPVLESEPLLIISLVSATGGGLIPRC